PRAPAAAVLALPVPPHPYLFLSSLTSHPPHPALPPFPTRRSSDLRVPSVHRRRTASHPDANRSDITSTPPNHRITSQGRAGSTTDRKSTRLNSSHEWISYAVFCLKKKKTPRQHILSTPDDRSLS